MSLELSIFTALEIKMRNLKIFLHSKITIRSLLFLNKWVDEGEGEGELRCARFLQGPTEIVKFLMVPFTEMENGGAEAWAPGGRNGDPGGKEGESEGESGQPVSPQDAQKRFRTPVR